MGQLGNHANKPAAITTAANSQKFTLSFSQCIFGEGGKTKEKSKWWLTITSPCMSFCSSSSHPPLHHIRVFSLILFHQTFKPKRVIPNGRSRARTKLWPSLTKKNSTSSRSWMMMIAHLFHSLFIYSMDNWNGVARVIFFVEKALHMWT